MKYRIDKANQVQTNANDHDNPANLPPPPLLADIYQALRPWPDALAAVQQSLVTQHLDKIPTNAPNPQKTAEFVHLFQATLSPLYFATHCLGFTPEPAQEKVLRDAVPFFRLALNCNRQWGKSTLAAILIAHRLFTHPNSTILIVAPAGRQAGETFRKVATFLHQLNVETHPDGINPNSMELPNGSRVVALPAVDGTGRGFSAVSMLVFDEASRIRDRVYLAFRPMLAVSKGDLILVSTPAGRRGFFYREMTATDETSKKWFRHTGPVSECLSRIDPAILEEEKAQGEAHYRQEWLCEFIETGRYVLDEEQLHKIIKKKWRPTHGSRKT